MAIPPRGNPRPIRAEFAKATPDSFRRVQTDPAALTQLAAIERRTARIKEKFRAHYDRHVETWVAREAARIWKRSAGLGREPIPAGDAGKEVTANGIMADARRNVHARATRRMGQINAIRTRLSNAVVRNARDNGLKPAFEQANQPQARRIKRRMEQ